MKSTSRNKSKTAPALRRRAEATLRTPVADGRGMTAEGALDALHELEVHQVELQIQNEELRHVQEELAQSRDEFMHLYDYAPIGYLTLTEDASVLRSNLTLCTMLGVSRPQLAKMQFTRFVAPEAQDTFYLHRHAALSSAQKHTCELLLRRADGSTFPAQLETIGIKDADTRAPLFRCVISDVSERKRAEAAARESDWRFRAMADSAPVLIWLSGIDKQCTWFNKPWLDFVGRPMEQELGKGWAENVHPEDFQRCLDTYSNAFDARQSFTMEYRLRRHDGEYRWVIDSGLARFAPDDEFVGYIGSCIDITERKQHEDALRASEARVQRLNAELAQRVEERTAQLEAQRARLQTIVDAAAEGIITIDEDGTIESINASALHMFGYSADEVLGRNVSMLMPTSLSGAHTGYLKRYLETGQKRLIGNRRTVTGRHKRGDPIPIEISISEVVLFGVRMFVGLLRDVSAQQRLEAQVRERSEDAAQLHRLRMAGELAGVLAHQLNQPLSAILSFAEATAARLRRGDTDAERTATAVAEIVEQAHRAAQVIRDLRQFLSRERDAMAAEDLNAIVSWANELMTMQANDVGIALHLDLSETLPPVMVLKRQIEQVLLVLLDNAIDAVLLPGPGEPARAGLRGTITVCTAVAAGGDAVIVTVRDSGSGLDETIAHKVFDPLYTTKATGIGLGLSIARSVIEAHGGRIWAEPGPYGLFHFTLPIAR